MRLFLFKTNEKRRAQEIIRSKIGGRERTEGESKPRLIRRILETTKERRSRSGKRGIDERSGRGGGMGYKGVCIHDRERKRVKMENECDRYGVGSTYPKSKRPAG